MRRVEKKKIKSLCNEEKKPFFLETLFHQGHSLNITVLCTTHTKKMELQLPSPLPTSITMLLIPTAKPLTLEIIFTCLETICGFSLPLGFQNCSFKIQYAPQKILIHIGELTITKTWSSFQPQRPKTPNDRILSSACIIPLQKHKTRFSTCNTAAA